LEESELDNTDIPEPEYDDPKELYAFFGMTFYYAQVLEQGIVNLAVALQASGIGGLTVGDVLDQYKGLEGRTFGNVLNAARKLTSIPASMDADLEQARKYRNYLTHSLFVKNSDNLLTLAGRKAMIDELRSMLQFITRVDEEFDSIWRAAWEKIGVSQAWFERQIETIRQRTLADQGDA
jgi:hypothetical protein